MSLVDPRDAELVAQAEAANPRVLRRTKEEMLLPNGEPLYPEREIETVLSFFSQDAVGLLGRILVAFAVERIVGQEGFSERLDQPTQFYLLWRWGYSEWDVPDGEAVLLSTAVGIDLGVLMDRLGLVGKVKGKLRLLEPSARAAVLDRVVSRVEAGGAGPLIDVLHAVCLLWERDRQEDLAALVAAHGGELWPVAQAIAELLSRDNPERKALESLLGTRGDLESRAQRWAELHRREPRGEVKQLGLWGEDA